MTSTKAFSNQSTGPAPSLPDPALNEEKSALTMAAFGKSVSFDDVETELGDAVGFRRAATFGDLGPKPVSPGGADQLAQ